MIKKFKIEVDIIPLIEDNEFLTENMVNDLSEFYRNNPDVKRAVMLAGSDMRVNSGINGLYTNKLLVNLFESQNVKLD